ncbi:hypothetical protein [Halobaculum sp. MBLA0143]|uniref:hypothetical protein n=1 Tax=Halobaculum sp. MBLA0143 TaxID=3079933 RepID=UPI00352545A5
MTDDALFDADGVASLIHSESVLDGVFDCLGRIWRPASATRERELGDSEYRTRQLEHLLADQGVDLYDTLEAAAGDHPIGSLDHGCGVVMDGLSLREGFALERDLRADHDWTVSLDWAGVERLPSETKFVCRAWFDARSPSAVSRDDFRYVGDTDVPQLPGTDPAFVWTRHPDRRLEASTKGNYSVERFADIYADTKGLLERVVTESVHEEFLVSSDHGYVNFVGRNPFRLSDDDETALADAVGGRYTDVEAGYAYDRLREANVIRRTGGRYVVTGHYRPTTRGASKRVAHGGLSIPEALTPVLRIDTR